MQNTEAKYGELAHSYGELEFNPENNEEHERLRQIARNIIDCYDWQPDKEDFLIVTDTKVVADNPFMLRALEHELSADADKAKTKKSGAGHFRTIVTEASPKSATP